MTVLATFAKWGATVPREHSSNAIQLATHAFTDTFACMIAGAQEHASTALRSSLGDLGASLSASSVMGITRGVQAPLAALANGLAAHALDLDDTFLPAVTHPSAVLVPALVALGQQHGKSGTDLLDAYIVGLELQYYLARGVMRSHYDIGFHTTSTVGCIGAAGACARLLGLDADTTLHAMSLSVSMAGGVKAQAGTDAKPLHAGLAAQHGIQAAILARAGVNGRAAVLEASMGFLEAFGGPTATGWDAVLPEVGKLPLAIESKGLMAKRFACCASSHRLVDCMIEMIEENDLRPQDIERVDTRIPPGNVRNMMYEDPTDAVQAKWSMPYVMSALLVGDRLTASEFTEERIARPEVRELMRRVTMSAFAPGAEQTNAEAVRPHEIDVLLKDGRKLQKTRASARGTLTFPFTEDDRWLKFRDCCNGLLDPMQQQHMYDFLQRLPALADVRDLSRFVFEPIAASMQPKSTN